MLINVNTVCSGEFEGKSFSFSGTEKNAEVNNGLGAELIRCGYARIVEAIPSDPAPVEPAPVEPAPVEPAPVEPATPPVEPATPPVEPATAAEKPSKGKN